MRFVLLKHHDPSGMHYDFMLERPGGTLRTWRLLQPPSPCWQSTREIEPHRSVYLRKRGPVYPSRGWVEAVDGGQCRVVAENPTAVRVLVNGEKYEGLVRIERTHPLDEEWKIQSARSIRLISS